MFEEVDVRKIECWNCRECSITYVHSPTIVLNVVIIWREGCSGNSVQTGTDTFSFAAHFSRE
jgi:hypothetical protein